MLQNWRLLLLAVLTAMLFSLASKRIPILLGAYPKRFAYASLPTRYFTWFGGATLSSSHEQHQSPNIHDTANTPPPQVTSFNYDSVFSSFQQCSVAVAFAPKNRVFENKFANKRLNNSSPSGEDNLFVSMPAGGSVAFGVADGVGGWAEKGYDSLAISRQLCASLRSEFEKNPESSLSSLLHSAYEETINIVQVGGTTACFGVLSPDARILRVLNLGDSWCGVFRDNRLVHETQFQTHAFNTPFQLSKVPEKLVAEAAARGRHYILDSPSDADTYEWPVQKGDLIMFATDGVTDNILPQDTAMFLRDNSGLSLDKIAHDFVDNVKTLSKDPNYDLVFSQEWSKLAGQRYSGGKEDDISVVLVKVAI